MLDASLFGSIDKVLSLLNFQLHVTLLPVVGDCVYSRGPLHGFDQSGLIIKVGLARLAFMIPY